MSKAKKLIEQLVQEGNISDLVVNAISTKNPRIIKKVVNFLRVNLGLDYKEMYNYVNKISRISKRDWENLLQLI